MGDGGVQEQKVEGGGKDGAKDGRANEEAAEQLAEDLRLAEAAGELGHAARGEKEGGDGEKGAEELVFGESVHGSWMLAVPPSTNCRAPPTPTSSSHKCATAQNAITTTLIANSLGASISGLDRRG